jgi:hypothetical protein
VETSCDTVDKSPFHSSRGRNALTPLNNNYPVAYDLGGWNNPMKRLRAMFAFISCGGLLIFLSPYLIHEAVIKHLSWSVPMIVIPMYALLSYGAFKLFRPHIIGRTGTTTFKQRAGDS